MEQYTDSPFDRPLVPVPTPFRNPLAPVAPDPGPVLLPLIARQDQMTPGLERILHPVALRAKQGDWTARDALHQAFEVKLRRICQKIPVPFAVPEETGVWDHEDVWQEGWIVFADLVERWEQEVPFGRYLLAQFPWRLRDAVRGHLRRSTTPPKWTFGTGALDEGRVGCPVAVAALDGVELRACLVPLRPFDRELIEVRTTEGLALADAAAALDVSERTVSRRLTYLRRTMPSLLGDDPV
jgi:DNA-directed RNA polymerase specialized sigma24 family protein